MPLRKLSPALLKIAKDELHEDPDPIRVQEFIDQLKDWVLSQPHIHAKIEDQWLLSFLRGAKYNMDRAKKKIELYYTLRKTAKEIIWSLNPCEPRFIELLRMGSCLVLPKASSLHPRIILMRPGNYDRQRFNLTDMLCLFYHMMQIMVNEDDSVSIVGVRILVDYRTFTIGYLTQVRPSVVRKIVVMVQESWPLRLKGSNHMYLALFMKSVMIFIRSLLNDKMKRRFEIHNSEEELRNYDHFPKEILPKEYGGTGGTLDELTEYWVNKFTEYKEWLKQDQAFGAVEVNKSSFIESTLSDNSFMNPNID